MTAPPEPIPPTLVIGEAMIDLVDGIPHPGGSPLNVAVGLSRLGVATSFHSAIGTDPFGAILANHLERSGVTLTASAFVDMPTSVAEAMPRPDGETTYDFSFAWNPTYLSARGFAWVHVGSLGAMVQPGSDVVDRMLQEADSPISFDPNIRPTLLEHSDRVVARVERLVALSEVVKASELDLAWLYPGEPLSEVVARWVELGPRLVVATRGGAGSMANHEGATHEIEPQPTSVVDTIGAGDSFMSGLLARILRTGMTDIDGILRFATRCAAVTVGRVGANPPWTREIVHE